METWRIDDAREALARRAELEAAPGAEGRIVQIARELWCVSGRLDAYRQEEADRLGCAVGHGLYLGGTVVVFPGDLSICIVHRKRQTMGVEYLRAAARYLATLGVEARVEGNDLMTYRIDLRRRIKIGSAGSGPVDDERTETVIHYSIHTDVDVIRQICSKPWQKYPGALEHWGVSAEQLWEAIGEEADAWTDSRR